MIAHGARREAYLQSRDDEKERRRREALRRIAPGYGESTLVPTTMGPGREEKDPMEELVNQLERIG